MEDTLEPPSVVLLERPADGVVLLRLNRPDARNALGFESWELLETYLRAVEEDSKVHCLILASAGKYFSAGGDLKTPPKRGARATAAVARLELAHRVLSRLRALPLPVIAAVEGGAIGLGWSLALACDFIVATADTKFAAPFVARGVVPDGGAGWFLINRVGRYAAAELLLAGKTLTGQEALQLGLISQLAQSGRSEAEALVLASKLPRAMPHAVELTKNLMAQAEANDLPAYLKLETFAAALTQLGPEAEAARQMFRDAAKASD